MEWLGTEVRQDLVWMRTRGDSVSGARMVFLDCVHPADALVLEQVSGWFRSFWPNLRRRTSFIDTQ